jgi:site-specific DNA-methyltransferase (adenine-specific)/adenine-specific DNA-methyltransferase
MVELVWQGKALPSLPAPTGHLITNAYYLPHEITAVQVSSAITEQGWQNRLIHADKSAALPALLTEFAGKVNVIYIDPPFMTGRSFKNGKQHEMPAELSYRDVWHNDLDGYLQWLYETFWYLYQLLTPSGCLYVHLDWRATHYARALLDEIFSLSPSPSTHGAHAGSGLKNEIIWHYQSGGRSQHAFARKHDTILLYTRSHQYRFHGERVGLRRGPEKRNHMRKEVSPTGQMLWTIRSAGKLYSYSEDTTMALDDVWSDISHLHQKDPERTGYATQKPAALLERLILASSEENDLVLDCFCGSGVTPAVAEQLGRRWLACDQSTMAITTTRTRLLKQTRRNVFVLQSVN